MKRLLFISLILTVPFILAAQKSNRILNDTISGSPLLGEVTDTVRVIDFFNSNEVLKISLKYDITSFIRHKTKGEYLDAELQIFYDEKNPIVKNVRIKARGNFRRGQCFFPPIFLNFKTSPIENPQYSEIKKVKIVTHCSTSKESQNNILKEYLAYKLYNQLTDKSFRVRLLDITYIDTGKKKKNYESYAFIIEPDESVAKRNNCVLIDPMVVKGSAILEPDADRTALFQYMISNTDWRFKSGHNTKFMKSLTEVTTKVIPVPYDFDFAGFVGANYAFPQEWSKTETIYKRDYLGYCRDNDDLYRSNISFFVSNEEVIMKTISDFKYLPDKAKKVVKDFTADFFKQIKSKNFVSVLKNNCRTIDF